MNRLKSALSLSLINLMLTGAASSTALPARGTTVRWTLHSISLERTLTGESADRAVSVYLPPSYGRSPGRRYPVMYLLHGVGDTDQIWTVGRAEASSIQTLMDRGVAAGRFGEMIVVMPDEQRAVGGGSYYLNSPVTGQWETFTTAELISATDARYRTVRSAKGRAIAGHSMGGYGALTLAMKHPEYYSAVYAMNPSLIGWQAGGDLTVKSPAYRTALRAKSFDELFKQRDNFYAAGLVLVAQAFSPNPKKPPFFADLPFRNIAGKLVPAEPAFSRWQSLNPVNMVPTYRENLARLSSISFDSGMDDEFRYIPINSRALSIALTNNGVPHVFEEYQGDHRNRLWGWRGRLYTKVLPTLWQALKRSSSADARPPHPPVR